MFSALSRLTYESGSFIGPIAHHAAFLLMGLVVVLIVHRLPCRAFRIVLPFAALFSIALLVLLLMGFGITLNGASRWFNFFGMPLQPSEIAKGTMIIYTALVLSWNQTEKGAAPGTFKLIFVPTVVVCGLIAPENLSTAILLFFVITLMMFIGRISVITMGKMFGVLAITASILIGSLLAISKEQAAGIAKVKFGKRVPTWKNRIESVIDGKTKKLSPKDFDIDTDAQKGHSNIAIATSNIIGKGPGNSVQRDFIPHAYSDFIYAIIVEELFPPFLAIGLALLIVVQALANMFVATGPFVTGQPLPLISSGGTSTLVNCAYIGMILSVSRLAKKQERKHKAAAHISSPTPEMPEPTDTAPEYIPPAELTAREIASANFGSDTNDRQE